MKVSDGRKTKGKIGQKNEKAKLDKEWNKVKNHESISKRKLNQKRKGEIPELLFKLHKST